MQNWPRIIDSSDRIFRAERTAAKDDEPVGDPIAPGVVRGVASVLNTPYEKPLNKEDILITRATDTGWTPLFMNFERRPILGKRNLRQWAELKLESSCG